MAARVTDDMLKVSEYVIGTPSYLCENHELTIRIHACVDENTDR